MPDIKFPEVPTDVTKAAQDLANMAKDAAYVVIGAGVLGYQKAQVQRHELRKRIGDPASGFEGRISGVRTDLGGAIHSVDAKVEDIIARIEAAFVPFEDRLPGQARDLAKQVHVQAKEARSQVRNRVLSATS
jgi:predicted component of type VI protein secretion system